MKPLLAILLILTALLVVGCLADLGSPTETPMQTNMPGGIIPSPAHTLIPTRTVFPSTTATRTPNHPLENNPDETALSITLSQLPDLMPSDYSTLTPIPTPSVHPGPTEIALPIPVPAKDPSGLIFYTTQKAIPNPDFPDLFTYSFSIFALEVNAAGKIYPSEETNSKLEEINLQLGNQISAIYPSPDGRYWIMLASSEGGSIPYIYDFEKSTGSTYFHEYGGGRFFGWHPDGQRFLFWIGGVALWFVDAETLETISLAVGRQSYLQGAAISPNGQWVAFIAENKGSNALWIVNSGGGDAKRLFDSGLQSYLSPTAWSPDGTQIAYYGNCTEKGDNTIPAVRLCRYNLLTGKRRAFNLPFSGGDPVWSPDGQFIAGTGFSPNKELCYQADMSTQEAETCSYDIRSIFIESVSSGSVSEIASGIQPVWSPDGSMIAFLSNKSGLPEVWIINLDGTGLQRLTEDGLSKTYFLNWVNELDK